MKAALQRAPRLDAQEAWTKRFLQNLKHDAESDSVAASLLRDHDLAAQCAVRIRTYVEPKFTEWLYRDRQDRMRQHVARLNAIIDGLKAQKQIEATRGGSDPDTEQRLQKYTAELIKSKTLLNVKRHGQKRAQFVLYEAYCFLLASFTSGNKVEWESMAALVAAGYNASGLEGFPSADTIRKNIKSFEERCPDMAQLVRHRFAIAQ
jgi:hypothetical protein